MILSLGLFISSSAKCMYDDLYTHLPLSFRILAHNAGPISVLGPSHLPKTHLSLGYATALSLKYTQSYQPNSHKCVMLAVSPFITVLGTSPLSIKTLFVVHDLISISNSKQSSHYFFGELDLIIFLPAPFFSSLMVLSAAFWPWGIWISLLHMAICLPSLTPEFTYSLFSHSIHHQRAWDPSCANKSDNVSCASLSLPLGMPYTMCSCGHRLGHICSPCVK